MASEIRIQNVNHLIHAELIKIAKRKGITLGVFIKSELPNIIDRHSKQFDTNEIGRAVERYLELKENKSIQKS